METLFVIGKLVLLFLVLGKAIFLLYLSTKSRTFLIIFKDIELQCLEAKEDLLIKPVKQFLKACLMPRGTKKPLVLNLIKNILGLSPQYRYLLKYFNVCEQIFSIFKSQKGILSAPNK